MIARRDVALAGHTGDETTAREALAAGDPELRSTALGALDRMDRLDDEVLTAAFVDDAPTVRRRAAELAASRPHLSLLGLLGDPVPLVAEMAAWACGEHEVVGDDVVEALIALAESHHEPLVREAAVAALGAIGDERGLAAVLAATADKPAIRRRAVIALVSFEGPDVDAALLRALDDKDWQVRDAAEELTRDV